MIESIRFFCKTYDFPEEAEQAFIKAAQAIIHDSTLSAIFQNHLAAYESAHSISDIKRCLEDVIAHAQNVAAHSETVEFLFFMLCTRPLKQLYEQTGYPAAYYQNIIRDLRCKLMECYKVKEIWGTFVSEWFVRFFSMDRFAIGRLQFEMTQMPPCISSDGAYCFNGEPAVNIHIPSLGPLKQDEIRASMREAADFFADRFPGDTVLFICQSWLLFPGHYKMLPETSGIRQFMDEFTIIHVDIDASLHDLWRIYDTFDIDHLETLPQKTSLQRIYIKWLRANRPLGAGLGIRYLPKNK